MTMTDPVADYLTRLRNALQAKHKRVDVPASNLKRELTKLLLDHKFIGGFTETKESAPVWIVSGMEVLGHCRIETHQYPRITPLLGFRKHPACPGWFGHSSAFHLQGIDDRSPGSSCENWRRSAL